MKTRVAMLFGGKSVEHEVSVISGIQAVMSMDTDKYEVIPVYMTKRNEMYIGEEIGKIESYWREETSRDRRGFPRSPRYQCGGRRFPGLPEDHGHPLRGL